MALLNFNYGLVKNVLAQEVKDGNLYIATDSQGLYVDLEGKRIHVSDFIQVATMDELNALGVYNTYTFYYVAGSNALLKYTGVSGSEWKQLNSTADLTNALNALAARVTTNEGDISALKSADATLDAKIDALNATDIETTKEITVTTAVGNYAKGAKISADTDLQTLILNMLSKDSNPTTTWPSITSISLTGAGAKEVGSTFAPSFTINTDAGKYVANGVTQASGVTFNNYKGVEVNRPDDAVEQTVESKTGTFASFVVTDDTDYYVQGSASHTAGSMPKTYLGSDYPDGQITAKDLSAKNSTHVTGFRSYFWGYKQAGSLLDTNALTSANIRGLGNPNANGTNQNAASTSVPATITTNKMQQMFFAFPKGIKTSVAVANNVNGAPQTVYGPVTVAVNGADGYQAIDYDVFYISNAAAESGSTTFKITIA